MEDIIALVLVVGIFALFVWGVTMLVKRMKREKLKREEQRIASEKFWEEERKKARKKIAVSTPMQGYVNMLDRADPVKVPKPKSYTTTTTTSTPATSSDDGFLTGMLVGAALDNIFSHKSESSPSVSSSSSWGLDDSDSRKSISDSMSSSWSDSSSSSDSWSSSDSGPSSDW